jgi:hypothetical protein
MKMIARQERQKKRVQQMGKKSEGCAPKDAMRSSDLQF